jgi:cell division protein FtsB
MSSQNLLRKQVNTELKVRSYIVLTLLVLSIAYIAGSLVFGDTGIIRYLELKENHASIDAEINLIMKENYKIESSIESLKYDDFYLEKHAREEFGLAGPDELIYIYK